PWPRSAPGKAARVVRPGLTGDAPAHAAGPRVHYPRVSTGHGEGPVAVLTAAQLGQFAEEGYLVVEDALDPARDIRPVMDEYAGVLDGIATALHTDGAIRSTYRGLPFAERLVQVCVESGRNFPLHFDFCLPPRGVRRDTPLHVGPAVFGLLTDPHLLDLVESIIGPEIYSNPIQHIRMKLPGRAVAQDSYSGLISRIPWHQDNGVLLP